ncbi:hypothetical protein BH11PSE11_BH11PSE11_04130 [soil metagenome]
MQDDIRNNLPWLVNGTLGAEDRSRLEAAIANNGDARAALNWETALRREVKSETAEWSAPSNALHLVMQRIAAEKASAKSQVKSSGVSAFITRIMQSVQATPKFAFACAVMAVQVGVIGYLWSSIEQERVYSDYRNAQLYTGATAFVRVMFKSNTTEKEIRYLLRNANAEIVAGPSQVGDYYLLVDPPQLKSTLTVLKSNKNIETAEIVDALPPKP